MIGAAVCILWNSNLPLPLSFPAVDDSLAELRFGSSPLELELFVFLGAASCVLRLGLPLFLLFGNKEEKTQEEGETINIQMSPQGKT